MSSSSIAGTSAKWHRLATRGLTSKYRLTGDRRQKKRPSGGGLLAACSACSLLRCAVALKNRTPQANKVRMAALVNEPPTFVIEGMPLKTQAIVRKRSAADEPSKIVLFKAHQIALLVLCQGARDTPVFLLPLPSSSHMPGPLLTLTSHPPGRDCTSIFKAKLTHWVTSTCQLSSLAASSEAVPRTIF